MTGFTQMAIGAISTQTVSALLAGSAMPMALQMLVIVLIAGVAFFGLARR